jgi:hypothetical protein
MAYPTPDNGPVIDAGTQPSSQGLGDAPAEALGTVYQALAQSVGNEVQNALNSQQQPSVINTAATAAAVRLLIEGDVKSDMEVPLPPAAGE